MATEIRISVRRSTTTPLGTTNPRLALRAWRGGIVQNQGADDSASRGGILPLATIEEVEVALELLDLGVGL